MNRNAILALMRLEFHKHRWVVVLMWGLSVFWGVLHFFHIYPEIAGPFFHNLLSSVTPGPSSGALAKGQALLEMIFHAAVLLSFPIALLSLASFYFGFRTRKEANARQLVLGLGMPVTGGQQVLARFLFFWVQAFSIAGSCVVLGALFAPSLPEVPMTSLLAIASHTIFALGAILGLQLSFLLLWDLLHCCYRLKRAHRLLDLFVFVASFAVFRLIVEIFARVKFSVFPPAQFDFGPGLEPVSKAIELPVEPLVVSVVVTLAFLYACSRLWEEIEV